MVRRVFHFWVVGLVCLAGCAPDNGGKVQTFEGRQCEVGDHIGSGPLKDIQALESVEPWNCRYGTGLRLTTTHYEIFTTLTEPVMLRRTLGFMESVYRAYNSQLPEVIETQTRLTIYLFADRRQWEDFTRDFAGEQARTFCRIKAGAYYHNGACVAYDIGPTRTMSVLGHEGWHQFSDKHFKFRLPSWLDEGVAMLFETNDAASGTFQLAPAKNAYRLDALRRTLENDRMIPLRDLIASNPGDVLATDRTEAVMAFYSQSYALVRFLQEADSGRRLAAYHRLLADGLRGRWQLDGASRAIAIDRNIPRNILWNHIVGLVLFEDYVGSDYDQIEKEYLAFCRQITQ
ncbi:MAG: hypothetical protein JSW59_18820 [Phycisphaerales bacterium]|nr:MAG: hypothetical protein JSW59_18820 [Phycisphaerales bacterium]